MCKKTLACRCPWAHARAAGFCIQGGSIIAIHAPVKAVNTKQQELSNAPFSPGLWINLYISIINLGYQAIVMLFPLVGADICSFKLGLKCKIRTAFWRSGENKNKNKKFVFFSRNIPENLHLLWILTLCVCIWQNTRERWIHVIRAGHAEFLCGSF